MKRRRFLKAAAGAGIASGALATGALAAAGLPRPALSQGLKQLQMVTTWPRNFPGLGTGAERLARRIGAMSGGSLTVKIHAAGELVPTFRTFDAVSAGDADIYHAFDYYWQAKSKAFNFFAAVPFGMTATEMSAWLHHGGGQELWDELGAAFDLKPFAAGNTGVQMGGWFNREIVTLEDIKGLKIRMPGLGGDVFKRIGAESIALPAGQIFPAMQSGKIAATEWFGPWNDLAFGLYKVAKFYYYPGIHEPGTTIAFTMNKKVWEGLSAEHQAIVKSAAVTENEITFGEFNAKNGEALATLVGKHGVVVKKFPATVLNAMGTAAGRAVFAAGNGDELSKKVYDSFTGFRSRAIAWSKLSDQAFWNARLLPFKYTP